VERGITVGTLMAVEPGIILSVSKVMAVEHGILLSVVTAVEPGIILLVQPWPSNLG
jgi:hypothetical protein